MKNVKKSLYFLSVKRREVHRGTIGSVYNQKFGADCFVNLKQGSIHKYYTREEVLGHGAYGKVWKVIHCTTGIVRAMK
jgi:calcium-dependent protein kinase